MEEFIVVIFSFYSSEPSIEFHSVGLILHMCQEKNAYLYLLVSVTLIYLAT